MFRIPGSFELPAPRPHTEACGKIFTLRAFRNHMIGDMLQIAIDIAK
jgi:hypothetical protein